MLENVQDDSLEVLSISKREALMNFNLAPLNVRRDIMMLGMLHKVVLGVAPSPFQTLFKRSVSDLRSHGFRNGISYHNKQLQDDAGRNTPTMLKRSLFGLVHVYNRLPQNVVDAGNVQNFQKKLHCIIKSEVDGNPKWDLFFYRVVYCFEISINVLRFVLRKMIGMLLLNQR